MRKLYFGDNLEIMREHIDDATVDLVYLDPPFNSNQTYNILFKTDASQPSPAQMEAFDDTWHWTRDTQHEYEHLITSSNVPTEVAKAIDAFRILLGENDVMAYLVMMTPRLLEIYRVLKSTGSMYLHCDPTASHYLKVICDQVFGLERFINEIVWQRTAVKGDVRRKWGSVHDVLLVYGGGKHHFSSQYGEKSEDYMARFKYNDEDGRGPYDIAPLDSPSPRPNLTYDYKGYKPPAKGWRVSEKVMEELDSQCRIWYPPSKEGRLRRKIYLAEQEGPKVTDVWTDIKPLQGSSAERLGFPTQKPVALLERIIEASTNEGDVVLDPFCGCGTTVAAAEKLTRGWIGIDITYLAIALIEQRLQDHYPDIEYEEHGSPKDPSGAKALFESSHKNFEMWAVRKIDGRPNPKGGGDKGTDGIIRFYIDGKTAGYVTVSVKGGETVNPSMVRDLVGTVEAAGSQMGILITRVEPTQGMIEEAAKAGFYTWPFNNQQYPKIQIITVQDILDGKKPDMPVEHGTLTKAPLIEDTGTQMKLT